MSEGQTMAFDDGSREGIYRPGMRPDPEFEGGHAPASAGFDSASTGEMPAVTRPVPNLDTIFDDPEHGEPGRDQMLVHVVWELVLVLAVAGVSLLLFQQDSGAFVGEDLRRLALSAAVLGALALGSAIALRAAAPNLAVGAIAVTAAVYFGHSSDGGLVVPLLVVLGLAATVGLLQGLLVTLLHVPAWAGGVVVTVGLVAWSSTLGVVDSSDRLYDPLPHSYLWVGGLAIVSIIAGSVGVVPGIRRMVARFRPVADPARRRGIGAAIVVVAVTVVSSTLAGLGGVLAVGESGTAAPSFGVELTALAMGAALLGGTSAFGRRGGVTGTILAVALVTVVVRYAEVTERDWPLAAVAGVVLVLGLVVTRVVERFGRPPTRTPKAGDDDHWAPVVHSSSASASRSWQPVPQSGTGAVTTTGGLWASDGSWRSS